MLQLILILLLIAFLAGNSTYSDAIQKTILLVVVALGVMLLVGLLA